MENLPRDKVLHFLMEGFKELAIPYLEHIIYVWDDKSPEFHNVLIQLYLGRVQSLMKHYLNSLPEGTTLKIFRSGVTKLEDINLIMFFSRCKLSRSLLLIHSYFIALQM